MSADTSDIAGITVANRLTSVDLAFAERFQAERLAARKPSLSAAGVGSMINKLGGDRPSQIYSGLDLAVRTISFRWIPTAALVPILFAVQALAQAPDCTPVITGLNPSIGPPEGGTIVTITGRNFQRCPVIIFELPCPNVSFGGTNVNQVLACTDTTLVVRTPPHQSGVVDVNVPRFNDGPGPTLSGAFTYTAAAVPVSTPRLLLALAISLGFFAVLRLR